MRKKKIVIFFTVAILLFAAVASFADTDEYYEGDGVTVFPLQSTDIVMKKEVVRIRPEWRADCEFVFYNKSDKTENILMGYPDWLNDGFTVIVTDNPLFYTDPNTGSTSVSEYRTLYNKLTAGQKKSSLDPAQYGLYASFFNSLPQKKQDKFREMTVTGHGLEYIYFAGYQQGKLPYWPQAWNLHDLSVIIDGKKYQTEHRPLGIKIKVKRNGDIVPPPQGAYVWRASFKPHETKMVRVRFSFEGDRSPGYEDLSYILKTGALWADKIGVADIYWDLNVHSHDSDGDNLVKVSSPRVHAIDGLAIKWGSEYYMYLNKVSPAGYVIKNNVIHWHFENLKPTEDINVVFESPQ